MTPKVGYVYALQPIGMDVAKIGCTSDPAARAEQIAAFSPVPMVYRHVLQVASYAIARLHDQAILGWSCQTRGYGEWREDLVLVDDLFAGVAPAVDVTGDFRSLANLLQKGRFGRLLSWMSGSSWPTSTTTFPAAA